MWWINRTDVLWARMEIMRKQIDQLMKERQDRLCVEGKHLPGELNGERPGDYWVRCPHCWKEIGREKK